jgi:hypothetical protein
MNTALAEALVEWEDHEECEFMEEVTGEKLESTSRWHTHYYNVFKDTRDGTYWKLRWYRGSTESCDDGIEEVEYQQVVPKEVTVIEYVPLGSE